MMNIAKDGALLSVILATDNYERVRTVIEHLCRQTIAKKIELVLITTSPDDLRAGTAAIDRFHSIVIVPVDTVVPLALPRAAGVRAASAPYVLSLIHISEPT